LICFCWLAFASCCSLFLISFVFKAQKYHPITSLSLSPSSLSYVISYVLKRVIRCSVKQPHKASCSRHYWKSPKTAIHKLNSNFNHTIRSPRMKHCCQRRVHRHETRVVFIILWRRGMRVAMMMRWAVIGMMCIYMCIHVLTARRASGFAYASASQNKTKVSVMTSVLTPKKHENTC
jgi:hypothetical protein